MGNVTGYCGVEGNRDGAGQESNYLASEHVYTCHVYHLPYFLIRSVDIDINNLNAKHCTNMGFADVVGSQATLKADSSGLRMHVEIEVHLGYTFYPQITSVDTLIAAIAV